MSEKRYRLQTESGLSEEYSLEGLRERTSDGLVDAAAQCTPDNGDTWLSLGTLVSGPEGAIEGETRGETIVATSESSDGSVVSPDSASTVDHSRSTRRLKRLSKTSGDSRIAKRIADRDRRKASGNVRKAKDLLGVTLANGRYTVKSQLGKGSMAYVFLAADSRLETDVVVKVPKPEKFATEDFRDRFKRESQLLVRFSHPHVVKVLDVGEYEELPYVVMQLLSGGSLADRMQNESDKKGRMALDSVKSWIREVGRALDFCFRRGMVHRDVKPANILFDEDNNPYVADFGLSKIMYGEHAELNSSETAAGIVLGTPNYISPEVVLGKKYDGRADQYSLGITIYHALSGSPPMQGNSATMTMINQTQKILPLLSDVRSDVPREFALAVQKSIEKKPKNRFDSCEDFAEAVLDGLRAPVSPPPATPPVPVAAAPPGPLTPASASSTAQKRPPKNGSRTSSESSRASGKSAPQNRSSKRSKPRVGGASTGRNSGSSQSLDPDLEWFDLADDPPASQTESLPPKAGGRRKNTKSKKAAKQGRLVIFGQELHPGLAIALGIGLVALLVMALFSFLGSDSDDVSVTRNGPEATADAGNTEPAKATPPKADSSDTNAKPASAGDKPKKKPENKPAESVKVAEPVTAVPAAAPASPPAKADVAATAPAPAVNKVVKPKPKPPTAKPVASGAGRYAAIPFEPSQGFTVGLAECPVLLSGRKVWDKSARAVRIELDGSYDGQAQTALSPDGRLFAAASKPPDQQNTAVTVWDTRTGKSLFEASGDSKRFVDVILLSSKSLYIGDRWSSELLVWNCETGKPGKSFSIEEAKFKRGNAAISQDGQYIAAVAHGRMIVLNAADGKPVGLMQSPDETVRMRRGPLKGSGKPNRRAAINAAEPVFAALQSLSFSLDQQELAGFATYPRSRMMCWSSQGELTVDQAAPSHSAAMQDGALQWFSERDAWLVSGNILDRNTGQVVLTTRHDRTQHSSVHVYDNEHLAGVLTRTPNELSLIPIPWETISAAVGDMGNTDAALLTAGTIVGLQADLSPVLASSESEVGEIRKALRTLLVREGLKVEQNSRINFQLRIAKTAEDKRPIFDRQIPVEQRGRVRGATKPPDADCVVVQLMVPQEKQPVWRVNLGTIDELGLADAAAGKKGDRLVELVDELNVPYFIPNDKQKVALPIVID